MDIFTIDGKIKKNTYQFVIDPELPMINFVEAMQNNRKVFKSTFLIDKIAAVSVWTTPKRTKTYPFARVYDTLSYGGVKITIIPAMVDYGKHGERGKIQPNTVDWMTSIGVYLVLGIYIEAERGKKGKLPANAGIKTKSSEGEPKFAKGQKFDVNYLQKQIETIIRTKPEIKIWNDKQIEMIPEFLQKGIDIYKKLSLELNVPIGDFSRMEKKLNTWRKDLKKFEKDCENESEKAQNREIKSNHKLEDVPGTKGKINIDFGGSRKLYLTTDSMDLNIENKTVKILEGKNASNGKYPEIQDIKDALIKLMIFKNSDFTFNKKELEKKLVCYLTGGKENVEDEFKKENELLIDECKKNNILLYLNKKIIK